MLPSTTDPNPHRNTFPPQRWGAPPLHVTPFKFKDGGGWRGRGRTVHRNPLLPEAASTIRRKMVDRKACKEIKLRSLFFSSGAPPSSSSSSSSVQAADAAGWTDRPVGGWVDDGAGEAMKTRMRLDKAERARTRWYDGVKESDWRERPLPTAGSIRARLSVRTQTPSWNK